MLFRRNGIRLFGCSSSLATVKAAFLPKKIRNRFTFSGTFTKNDVLNKIDFSQHCDYKSTREQVKKNEIMKRDAVAVASALNLNVHFYELTDIKPPYLSALRKKRKMK